MRNKIKQLFEEVKVPKDDRHSFLFKKLVDLFDEQKTGNLLDLLGEGFELVHIDTQKRISISNGYEDNQWEVREYNELEGKSYKTLEGAVKSASK